MLDTLLRIFALTRKELLAILKDPRSRFSILLPPILQCLIYGYVATYDLNDVPYAVLDQDRSAASQKLLAGSGWLGCIPARSQFKSRGGCEEDDRRAKSFTGDSDRSGFRAHGCSPACKPTCK